VIETFRRSLDMSVEELQLCVQCLRPWQECGPCFGTHETDALVERRRRQFVVASEEVRATEE